MSDKFIRMYQKIDVKSMKPHLMVYGDLGGHCENCGQIDIKLDVVKCPQCENDFHYIAFRNIKVHIPKLYKITEDRPNIHFIDYDDYKREIGSSKAQDFFK